MTPTYTYEIIDIDDLVHVDLAHEAHEPSDSEMTAARVTIDLSDGRGPKAERAEVLYVESVHRAGIAWGAPADWTDASSIEDALDRYLSIGDEEMQV